MKIAQQLIDNLIVNKSTNSGGSVSQSAQSVSWFDVKNKPTLFPSSPSWADVQNKPETFPCSVSWNDVKNKPLLFPSEQHNNTAHSEQYATVTDMNIVDKKNKNIAVAMAIALG